MPYPDNMEAFFQEPGIAHRTMVLASRDDCLGFEVCSSKDSRCWGAIRANLMVSEGPQKR